MQASTETAGNIHSEFSSSIDSIKSKIKTGKIHLDYNWVNQHDNHNNKDVSKAITYLSIDSKKISGYVNIYKSEAKPIRQTSLYNYILNDK